MNAFDNDNVWNTKGKSLYNFCEITQNGPYLHVYIENKMNVIKTGKLVTPINEITFNTNRGLDTKK